MTRWCPICCREVENAGHFRRHLRAGEVEARDVWSIRVSYRRDKHGQRVSHRRMMRTVEYVAVARRER